MDGLVLLAAGASRRFGGGSSKILRPLAGTPLLVRALAPFLVAVERLSVVIVTRPGDRDAVQALLPRAALTDGGASRIESLQHGIEALPGAVETILVHDAARPLASADLVRAVLAAARRHGAAAPVVAVPDPLHRIEGGGEDGPSRFADTLDRRRLGATQSPLAAAARLLRPAVLAAREAGLTPGDEVELLLLAGVPVVAVRGETANVRVRTPEDLALAEGLLVSQG